MHIDHPFIKKYATIELPPHTRMVGMEEPVALTDCAARIRRSLAEPIDSPPLVQIARQKLQQRLDADGEAANAVIVVSDKTRPVPYKGEQGILLPIVEELLSCGYRSDHILVLIATGTHLPMSETEIHHMIDPRIKDLGIRVVNHDCKDYEHLTFLGKTTRGTDMYLNSRYVEADLKIATGLVESHFMAGASGGRKAICPGIIGEASTHVFHGFRFMADPNSCDLNLKENLVHEEAVEVASAVGIDFLVNVTLDADYRITGIFSGNFIRAHLKAVEFIAKCVKVPAKVADVVVTHGGFVGINHYQLAKCAVASLGILKKNGYLVIVADTNDPSHPVGGVNYITTVALLTRIGAEAFTKLIAGENWQFIPEQWQVQMWCKVFERIPMDHLIFYSPSMDRCWYPLLPGVDGNRFVPEGTPDTESMKTFVTNALAHIATSEGTPLEKLAITWIEDGPYVVPQGDYVG